MSYLTPQPCELCLSARRCRIVLAHKNIDHDVEFVEFNHAPTWLPAVSPLNKVPAQVVGDAAFFGPSVMNEYLDEQSPLRLHALDKLQKALCRSWIEFGGECMSDIAGMMLDKNEAAAAREALLNKFDRLEQVVGADPYFNGRRSA